MRITMRALIHHPPHPKALAFSRWHCEHCHQPVDPGRWVRISYDYNGRMSAYLACPVCLGTQTLLPGGRGPAAHQSLN